MTPQKADGGFDKDFYLKAVASVTPDPNGNHIICKQTLFRPYEFLTVAPTASSQRDAGPEWRQLSLLTKVFRGSRAKRASAPFFLPALRGPLVGIDYGKNRRVF